MEEEGSDIESDSGTEMEVTEALEQAFDSYYEDDYELSHVVYDILASSDIQGQDLFDFIAEEAIENHEVHYATLRVLINHDPDAFECKTSKAWVSYTVFVG